MEQVEKVTAEVKTLEAQIEETNKQHATTKGGTGREAGELQAGSIGCVRNATPLPLMCLQGPGTRSSGWRRNMRAKPWPPSPDRIRAARIHLHGLQHRPGGGYLQPTAHARRPDFLSEL